MSAFLDLNGIPASGNRRLLTDVLRGGWDFDGFVVSDWNSVLELVDHGVAEDRAQAAAIALHAGVDMDMVSNAYLETLADNMKAGEVTQAEIDEAVRRILRIKLRAGLFELLSRIRLAPPATCFAPNRVSSPDNLPAKAWCC